MFFLSKKIKIIFTIKVFDNNASLTKIRVTKIYNIFVSTFHDKRKKIALKRD
jgi:hypothetical protein